jgi:hypothetical protein
MSWYKTGTISVTNNSPTVTGSGTAWIANTAAGEAIYCPDGKFYEIASVNSDTGITLSGNYTGTSLSGQGYTILPSQSFIRDLAAQAADLINSYADIANNAGAGKFGDGTLGAPGISFVNDTNTGIRRTADGTFRLVSNGTDIAEITSTGLAVTGALSCTGNTTLGNAAGDTLNVANGSLTLDSSGNLLVGTASLTIGTKIEANTSTGSAAALVCATAIDYSLYAYNKATSSDNKFINFGTEASFTTRGNIDYNRTNNALRVNGSNALALGTGGTTRALIDSSGNLMVGTASLTIGTKIEANTSTGSAAALVCATAIDYSLYAYNKATSSDNKFINFGTEASFTTRGNIDYDRTNNALRVNGSNALALGTGGTTRALIDSSGNLLVGTTSVAALTGGFNLFLSPGYTGSPHVITGHASGTASGNYYAQYMYDGTTIGSINQNGTTAVAYNTSSDYRLKNNVRPADAKRFMDIQFRDFEWVDGRHDCGVIAHELQAVYPDLVFGEKDGTELRTVEITPAVPAVLDEEGNEASPAIPAVTEEQEFPKYQQVNYMGLIGRMGTVIQQQQKMIEAMEARLAALEAK